jgi:hypothetical protein
MTRASLQRRSPRLISSRSLPDGAAGSGSRAAARRTWRRVRFDRLDQAGGPLERRSASQPCSLTPATLPGASRAAGAWRSRWSDSSEAFQSSKCPTGAPRLHAAIERASELIARSALDAHCRSRPLRLLPVGLALCVKLAFGSSAHTRRQALGAFVAVAAVTGLAAALTVDGARAAASCSTPHGPSLAARAADSRLL